MELEEYRPTFHQAAESIRKENKSIYNRLHSISEDSEFVKKVRATYSQYPLVSNERCGTWYCDPNETKGSVYFKSTDGHYGKWDFNLRRLNLHLISIILENDGVIVVDSTRRGKRFPDSLSKTLPIWCCVLNRTITQLSDKINLSDFDTSLHVRNESVFESEKSQIEELTNEFSTKLLNSGIDLNILKKVKKPLRPIWVSPDSSLHFLDNLNFIPIICVNASKVISNNSDESVYGDGIERRNNYYYIQGSADDHEMWAMGLTPQIFWNKKEELLNTSSENLIHIVKKLTEEKQIFEQIDDIHLIKPSLSLFMTHSTKVIPIQQRICIICENILGEAYITMKKRDIENWIIYVRYEMDKNSPKLLTYFLPRIFHLIEEIDQEVSILIISKEETLFGVKMNMASGIGLALLCRFYDEQGKYKKIQPTCLSKMLIRQRLLWITSSSLGANPTRYMLTRINEFFLSQGTRIKWFEDMTCQLKSLSKFYLFSCGSNGSGQLGLGHLNDVYEFEQVSLPTYFDIVNIRVLRGGGNQSVFITKGGEVWMSGTFSTIKRCVYSKWNMMDDIDDVVTGWTTTHYLKNGKVYGEGTSAFGQVGNEVDQKSLKEYHTKPISLIEIDNIDDITYLATGMRHCLACSEKSNMIWGWGTNRHGEMGIKTDMKILKTPIQIPLPFNEYKIKQVSCGFQHSLFLFQNGKIYTCGSNRFNQLGLSNEILNNSYDLIEVIGPWLSYSIKQITCSWNTSYAIDEKGRCWSWGKNNHGQLGRSNINDIIGQVEIPVYSKTIISSGSEHCMVLQNNKVYIWGWNEHGNCGLNHKNDIKIPIQVKLINNFKVNGIAAGCGTSWIWGYST